MNVFAVERLSVSSLGECTFECINHEKCYSVNFGHTSTDGKHSCQLLRIDKFTKVNQLVASDEYDHYYIKTPCMSYPCQNGATCWPSYSKDDYKCQCEKGFTGKHCDKVNWKKMKSPSGGSSVCFGDRGDAPGIFTTPSRGEVITIKLVHLSGKVSCTTGNYSNWGCNFLDLPKNMETLITDSDRNRLLPNDQQLFDADLCGGVFYGLPGHTPDSPELLFDNLTIPLPVTKGQQFQIWWGEDIQDCGEQDNGGKQACVEVYGLYV
ncbi:hypothetical protein ACROYT_G039482 [Oculina patagonica]